MTTTQIDAVKAEIEAGIHDMYVGFVEDDRERFDSHLASESTTWESHFDHLLTRAELDAFRDARAEKGAKPRFNIMRADVLQIDVWDDTAVVRYLLRTGADEQSLDTTRVTEVLRRHEDGWRVVHHHGQFMGQ